MVVDKTSLTAGTGSQPKLDGADLTAVFPSITAAADQSSKIASGDIAPGECKPQSTSGSTYLPCWCKAGAWVKDNGLFIAVAVVAAAYLLGGKKAQR